ncbi:MAG: ATPase [bacterium]|nr:ATPase [bacterium]
MAQRGILEYDAKSLVTRLWNDYIGDSLICNFRSVLVETEDELDTAAKAQDWLNQPGLVVKPDMLFGKRGKNNLVLYKTTTAGDVSLADAKKWIHEKRINEIALLNGEKGWLRRFIIEPFVPHSIEQEYYISFRSETENDVMAISACGGVDIEENWDTVTEVFIPVLSEDKEAKNLILSQIPDEIQERNAVGTLAVGLYSLFKDLHFAYLELNPFVIEGNTIHLLDMVAKLDDTAGYLMQEEWQGIEFPSGFGRAGLTKEEKFITELDEKSGASLKLTILNPKGVVWTLVAGGGASVVFADTIANTWGANELANYGEYSGNPNTEETYYYTKTVLDLMTREKDDKGRNKILLIGGAIANFTDVASTFKGIIQAMEEYAPKMREIGVQIYVRRGGPNYEIGLRNIKTAAKKLKLPIDVYGPETHMTDIVAIAMEDANA